MVFQEPTVELIEIEMNTIITTSTCTTNANATPDMQVCSVGAPHDEWCEDEADDWYCPPNDINYTP